MELEKISVGIEVDPSGLTKLKGLCGGIKKNIDEVAKSAQKAMETGEDVTDIVIGTKGLGDSIKKNVANPIKKVIGSLLGVAGAYAVIKKAASAYLSQNNQLQERIDNIWLSLGNLLAPVIEWLVTLCEKLVAYIQAFARGLGISTTKATNLAKATNKALAGFDELNNLGSGASSDNISSLTDVEVNDDLVEALEKLGKKIANLKDKIGELVLKIQSKLDFLEPIENWTEGDWTSIIETALEGLLAVKGVGLLKKLGFSGNAMLWGFDIAIIVSSVVRFADAIIEGDKFKISNEAIKNLFAAALGISAGMLTGNLLVGFTVYAGVKVVLDIVESIGNVTTANYTPSTTKYDSNGNYVISSTSTKSSSSSSSSSGSSKSAAQIAKSKQTQSGKTIKVDEFAVGTNYVPNDQLAYIHKGEAVVPRAFNEDYFIQSGETNALLRELINVVNSKDFKAYISQKDVGKAAVSYINNQSRILGGRVI